MVSEESPKENGGTWKSCLLDITHMKGERDQSKREEPTDENRNSRSQAASMLDNGKAKDRKLKTIQS